MERGLCVTQATAEELTERIMIIVENRTQAPMLFREGDILCDWVGEKWAEATGEEELMPDEWAKALVKAGGLGRKWYHASDLKDVKSWKGKEVLRKCRRHLYLPSDAEPMTSL